MTPAWMKRLKYHAKEHDLREGWDWLWSIEHHLPWKLRLEVRWRYLGELWGRAICSLLRYYNDPEHPDRLVSDIAGGVVVLVSILILFFWLPLR